MSGSVLIQTLTDKKNKKKNIVYKWELRTFCRFNCLISSYSNKMTVVKVSVTTQLQAVYLIKMITSILLKQTSENQAMVVLLSFFIYFYQRLLYQKYENILKSIMACNLYVSIPLIWTGYSWYRFCSILSKIRPLSRLSVCFMPISGPFWMGSSLKWKNFLPEELTQIAKRCEMGFDKVSSPARLPISLNFLTVEMFMHAIEGQVVNRTWAGFIRRRIG